MAPQVGCGCEMATPIVSEPVCGIESYGGVINDPYLTGQVVGDGVMMGNGGIISNGTVIDGQIIGGSSMPGTVMPDNFVPADMNSQGYRSNRVDTDGARIISEEPLPPGVVPAS